MRVYTVGDIRECRPCYDPVTGEDENGDVIHPDGFVEEDWTGTIVDVLRMKQVPFEDRVWVASRLLSPRTMRRFAVWRARKMVEAASEPDLNRHLDVAEAFANGARNFPEMEEARIEIDRVWGLFRSSWSVWSALREDARYGFINSMDNDWDDTTVLERLEYLINLVEAEDEGV